MTSDSLRIALRLSSSINDITAYYRKASEGLFDDDGTANDPSPEAVLGSLLLDTVRSFVLKHSTQGQEAMLSLVWGTVESAQKSFQEMTEQFEAKVEEVKAVDSRWDEVDKDKIRRTAKNSELYLMVTKLIEARWAIPRVPSVTIHMPTTRSSLGTGTTPWEMFEYKKLESPKDTIRLVRMESISESLEPPIRITTRTVPLQDNVPYATLSYTWGNPFGVFGSEKDRDAAPRTDIPIVCDGKILDIGENLYRFLCRWRQGLATFAERMREHDMPDEAEESRPPAEFWIDAICINQADLEEKSQQVSIMGDIYTKSAITWVWLGEHDQFSREAFGVLQTLISKSDGANDQIPKRLEADHTLLTEFGLPDTNSWKWFAVFALFQRQWFRRSWVVQEAALSSHILFQCGSLNVPAGFHVSAYINIQRFGFLERMISNVGMHEIGFTRFELQMVDRPSRRAVLKRSSKASTDLRYHPCREGVEVDFGGMLARIMRIKVLDPNILANDKNSIAVNDANQTFDTVSALLDLWKLSRNTLCGNPRDKVFAFASLANRDIYRTPNAVKDLRALDPDYKKSVCEVYCEAAWFTILTHGSLDMLSIAGHTPLTSEHDLPSWVPDLSRSPRFLALNAYFKANIGIGWRASGGRKWEVPIPAERYGRHLGVQVSFVGKIQETDHEQPEFSNDEALKVNFKQFLEFSKLLPSTYLCRPEGQSRFEVIWRTVVADVVDGIAPAPPKYAAEFEKLYMGAIREVFDDRAVGNDEDADLLGTWAAMKDMGRLHDISASGGPLDKGTNETANFRKRVTDTMDKRRLFLANTGHVGCGDSRLSVGDLIVVIAGSSVPFLLRPGSSGTYVLIGEAYVHGIMFGEHASKPDAEWVYIKLE